MLVKIRRNEIVKFLKSIFLSSDKKSGVIYLTVIMLNCIIGTGLVSLPSAAYRSGFALSMLLISFSCVLSAHTCLLLVIVANKINVSTYSELMEVAFGKVGRYLLYVCSISFPSFIVIAYGIAMGDVLTFVFKATALKFPILQERWFLLTVSIFGFILWVSLPKHLAFLEKLSCLSILFVFFYCCVFIYKTPELMNKILTLDEDWKLADPHFFQILPILLFSFSIHHNILHFSAALKNFSVKRFCCSLFISFSFSMLIYIICIISLLFSFTRFIESNLFNNYCETDSIITAARLIFFFTIVTTYPLQLIAVRHTVMEILKDKIGEGRLVRYGITIFLIVAFTAISFPLKDIKFVIEIGGALSASPIIMIFPPLIYMKLVTKNYMPNSVNNFILWTIILVGLFITILAPVLSILSFIQSFSFDNFQYYCF